MNQQEQQFLARVTNAIQQAYQYQDENLKAKARSVMPVEDINSKARIDYNAERELNQPNQKSLENHIIRHLLSWFKGSFFTWTNNPPCDSCKSTNTKLIGGVAPNAYEQQGLAGVVELYQCSDCQQNTRFPRYNHAGRLLETKRGRCGEWAQAFTLCCNALGYEARFVNDWTDHVWTEVYIDSRWQHADSCEQVLDAPMMYESGWGKKLSFVVAASTEEVTDVTMRYTRQFHTPEFQERRAAVGVSEQFVKQHLERLNQQLSFALAPYRIQFLAKRMTVQLEEFEKNNTTQPYLNLKPEELIGRISGSEEWKESRGETGGSCPTPAPLRTLKDLLHNHAVFTKVKPILSTTSTSVTDKIICLGHATKKIAASDQTTEHDFYRLTEDKGAQVGAIWYNQQLPVTSFISKFKFCMTKSGVGADGMAFVIQNHGLDAIGSDGGGKGYDGIPKSIAIEMDTYKSTGEHDDNHIAIHTRKLEKNSSDMSSAIAFTRGIHTKMSDASPHTIQVLYDHTQKELHVAIDNNLVLEKVSWDMSVLGSHVWMGFTAGTGGFHQVHDLLEWELECIRDDEYLVFFKTANVDGIAKKLNEFDAVEKKMNEEDKKTLHELLYDKQITCNDKHYALIDKLLHYGPAHAFPVLDMLRLLLARHPTTMIKHYADQCAKNEGNIIQFMLNESPFSKVKLYANQMIMYRLLCNLFADSSAVQFLYDNQHVVLDALLDGNVWKATKNDKPPAKSAYASVLLNYSVFCTSKFEEQEIIIRLITALAEILEENKADAQESTLVNCMVALKVCLEDGEDEDGLVKGLAMSLEVDNTLTEIIKLHQDQKELVIIANHLRKLFTE